MGMSEAARALWVKVYDRLSAERLGLYGKMTSRAEAQTRRLACLFALLDKRAAVEVSHLKAALAVWAFADRTVRFVFGEQIGDALADTLLAALRKAGANGCTLSDLHAATGRNVKASILHEKLSFLERNGYARHVPEPPGARGGHPGERWYSVEQDDAPAPNEATKNDLTEETGEDVPSSGVDSSDSFFVASSRNGYHPELHPWKPLYDELVAGGMDPRDALFQAKAESQRGDTR